MSKSAPIVILTMLGVLFAVAHIECAAAQQHQMPTLMELSRMSPQELEKALDDMEEKAKNLPEDRRARQMRFVARARASRIIIGIHGEIVVLSPRLWSSEYCHLLVKKKDGSAAIMKEPMDPSSAFASISKKGEFKLAKPEKAGGSRLNALPKTWPFKDEKGNVTAPKAGTVVMQRAEKVGKKMEAPLGALGWLYLDINNSLNAPPKGLEPFPNVVWVYRRPDGGLRFEHSGPEDKGVYAIVSGNGLISFENARGIPEAPPGEAFYWDLFSMEDGMPCMLPPEATICFVPSSEPEKIKVDRFGHLYVPGKPVP